MQKKKLHIAQISMKNRSRIAFFLYSSFFNFLDFGIFALHSLVENLNVGEDGFPIRRIEGHHVLHVQKRIHPEFFVRDLDGGGDVGRVGMWVGWEEDIRMSDHVLHVQKRVHPKFFVRNLIGGGGGSEWIGWGCG